MVPPLWCLPSIVLYAEVTVRFPVLVDVDGAETSTGNHTRVGISHRAI